jgi:cysteine desulfurase/selenocysteine lyase
MTAEVDLDAMQAMLTERTRSWWRSRMSPTCSVPSSTPACGRTLPRGRRQDPARRLPGSAAHAGRCTALGCDFYVFSAHKLYGPTGIGVLWGKGDLLDSMPPMHGGGAMIDKVSFAKTTFAPPPARFEAGTPHVVGVLGLHAAIDYVENIGLDAIHAHETALVRETRDALSSLNSVRLLGRTTAPASSASRSKGCIRTMSAPYWTRAGLRSARAIHCAQPLMEHLGLDATARASFGVYNGNRMSRRLSAASNG